MSKEKFKIFAKNNPELASKVLSGQTTWQKLYEIYDIYGESSSIWDQFIQKKEDTASVKDIFNTIRNLDMESVQKGVANLQKTIGLLQELGLGSKQNELQYEPRPLYRSFED